MDSEVQWVIYFCLLLTFAAAPSLVETEAELSRQPVLHLCKGDVTADAHASVTSAAMC